MTSSQWSQFFSWQVLINSGKDFAIGTKLSWSNLWPFSPLSSSRDLGSGSSLSFSRLFYDEHWSKHRVITCLDWSPQVRPETFPNSKWFAKNEPCLCWYFFLFISFCGCFPSCKPFPFSLSILSCWLPPITIMRMLHTNQMALLWCGTSSLRRPPQSTSFTVRYVKHTLVKPHIYFQNYWMPVLMSGVCREG